MNAHVAIVQNGKPTPQYMSQWRMRGQLMPSPVLPLPANLTIINDDRTPSAAFASLYRTAWGQPLTPQIPICDPEGLPTPEHLTLWP